MKWRIFAPKCGACGHRANDQVPAPTISGLALGTRVCQVCQRKFEREEEEAARQREAELQRIEISLQMGRDRFYDRYFAERFARANPPSKVDR